MSELAADDLLRADSGPGFCGKLPSHRDFVSRRVALDLLTRWGEWLDAAIEHSRDVLGDAWLASYLGAPLWRFSVSRGCCGDRPFAGVMMPSLDRIGRYYPLSILALTDPTYSAAEIAVAAAPWFERIEALALCCLTDDFDFNRFDTTLAGETLSIASGAGDAASPTGPSAALPRLLGRLLEEQSLSYCLWWTVGSPTMAAACRAFHGLPSREDFCKLLG